MNACARRLPPFFILLALGALPDPGAAAALRARPAAWASAIKNSLKAWDEARLSHHMPALRHLAGLDIAGENTEHNIRRFGLLIRLMEPLRPGETLSPESFAKLTLDQQEIILGKASTKASWMTHHKARKLIADFKEKKIPGPQLSLARSKAEFLVFDHDPYLSDDNRAHLRRLLPALQQAARDWQEGKVDGQAEAMARYVREETGQPAPAEEAPARESQTLYTAGAYEGWLYGPAEDDEEEEESPAESARQEAALKRFDPDRALTDDSPVQAVKRRHAAGLLKAARVARTSGATRQFWREARAAFKALDREVENDGLSLIRRLPLGPWARERIRGYRVQYDDLYEWMKRLRLRYHIDDWGPKGRGTFEMRNQRLASLNHLKTGKEQEDAKRLARARRAADALEPLRQAPPSEVVPHFLAVVAFVVGEIKRALRNPDPYHLEEIREKIRQGGWEDLPALDHVYRLWQDAAQPPAVDALRARAWKCLMASTAGAFWAFLLVPVSLPLLIAPIALCFAGLGLAIHYYLSANRFMDLGEQIGNILRWAGAPEGGEEKRGPDPEEPGDLFPPWPAL